MSHTGRSLARGGVVTALVAITLAATCRPADVARGVAAARQAQSSLERDLASQLEAYRAANGAPGAVLGVVMPDGRVVAVAAGRSDTARGIAMHPRDRLLMGSVGKTYVAATALQLVRDGRLDLDAPVSRYVGGQGWFDSLPHAPRITVRHLMNHTSGLVRYEFRPEFTAALSANPDKVWDPREQVRYLHGNPAPFAPGEGWDYSDTNYLVLALVLEAITQRPIDTEIRERFLVPQRLTNTLPSDARVLEGVVQGYAGAQNPFGGQDAMLADGRMIVNPQFEGAGGGYAASAADAARWGALYFAGQPFGEAMLAQATQGIAARGLGANARYGLGMILRDSTAAGPMRGHSGFFPGYLTELRHYTRHGITVALMMNASNVRMRPPMGAWVDQLAATLAAPRAESGPPASNAYLALLPDGETKRRFIVDCTGCHVFDARTAFPNGAPRTLDSWVERIGSMHARFGRGAGFPIIADPSNADSLARWLVQHLRQPPASTAAPAPNPRVTEFLFPVAGDLPHDVIVAPDGRVVVTGMFSGQMFALDTVTGAFEAERIPVPQANPRAHHIDADGTWWVLLGGPGLVVRRAPGGDWSTHDVGMYAHSIARDATGVWVNGHFTGHPSILAHVHATTGAVTRVELPSATAPGISPIPYELRTGPDGRVWMSELHGGRVIAYDPRDRSHRVYPMPVPHSGPRRLDVARDGTVWIPLYSAGEVVALDPASGRTVRHALPDRDALPYVVRVDDARDAVWIGTGASDAIYRLHRRTGAVERIALPSRGALVRHLDVDAHSGDLWVAYGASPGTLPARIARVRARG